VPRNHPTETSQQRFRVVLADDHEDVLHEIRLLLDSDFDILNSVTDGLGLIEAASESKPDIVISDIQMPGINGIEACQRIVESGSCGAAIILTVHDEPQLVKDALRAGIRGYVLKVDAGDELIRAVRSVLGGFTYLSRGVSKNLKSLGN
jgi:DNA-binding NarL/FixJ family response regulator